MNATLLDRLAGMVPEAALRANACNLIVARMLTFGWLMGEPGAASSEHTLAGEDAGKIPEPRDLGWSNRL